MDFIPLNQNISIGELADEIASQTAFSDYQTRATANTLRQQQAGLELFATFLSKASNYLDSNGMI